MVIHGLTNQVKFGMVIIGNNMPSSFKIKIPLTSLQPKQTFQDDLRNSTGQMLAKYGNFFRAAAAGTNLPVQFLYAIAMVETTGSHYYPSGAVNVSGSERSTGILQVSPSEFYEVVYKKELPQGRLSQASLDILNKYLPSLSTDAKYSGTPSPAVLNRIFLALKKPEFNIWAGAMVLRRLIEETANPDGTMRPDKAIIKYNVGDYSKPTKLDVFVNGDTTSLVKAVNSITSAYIVKVTGANGGMDYYLKNQIA